MRILTVPNVHVALPRALQLLDQIGEPRESRNGPVLLAPYPVTTIYEHPQQRVLFWPERDANPFFHLYESLWMLAGRNDVAPLVRYAKNVGTYSDDGVTFWGAYGHRWRKEFKVDQLEIIAQRLIKDPNDRRNVLQMWETTLDLGNNGRDVPCNTTATFQIDNSGKLNIVVFNRSNDLIWGTLGANAVQFSVLLEYMAAWIGCPIGAYTQISVNWHGYLDTIRPLQDLRPDRLGFVADPYNQDYSVWASPMPKDHAKIDAGIKTIIQSVDDGYKGSLPQFVNNEWAESIWLVLFAHHLYKTNPPETKFKRALEMLDNCPISLDWAVAAREWITRRQIRHENKRQN